MALSSEIWASSPSLLPTVTPFWLSIGQDVRMALRITTCVSSGFCASIWSALMAPADRIVCLAAQCPVVDGHAQIACGDLRRKDELRGRPRTAVSRSAYRSGPQYVCAVASGRAHVVVEIDDSVTDRAMILL